MIGPRHVRLVVCDGCDALRTKEINGTATRHVARCGEAGDRLISAFRTVYDAPPAWCPVAAPQSVPLFPEPMQVPA